MKQTVCEDMTAVGIRAELNFIDCQEFNWPIQRHRFNGADEPLRIGRDQFLFTRDKSNGPRTLQGDDTIVVFPRQQAQWKSDHAAGMSQHTINCEMGLSGIRGAEHGPHDPVVVIFITRNVIAMSLSTTAQWHAPTRRLPIERRRATCGSGLSNVRLNPILKLAFRQRTNLGCGYVAILEKHQRGDSSHTELRWRRRVIVDVQFGDGELVTQTVGNFFEGRADHLAGAAPLGPKIDENRTVGSQDAVFEIFVADLYGAHASIPSVMITAG